MRSGPMHPHARRRRFAVGALPVLAPRSKRRSSSPASWSPASVDVILHAYATTADFRFLLYKPISCRQHQGGESAVDGRGWQHIEYVIGFNIDRRVYDVLRCMPTVPGAIGAFRRAALEQVGGVSSDTLAEDTDLTIALCRAGWAWSIKRTRAPGRRRQRGCSSYGASGTGGATEPCSRCGSTVERCSVAPRLLRSCRADQPGPIPGAPAAARASHRCATHLWAAVPRPGAPNDSTSLRWVRASSWMSEVKTRTSSGRAASN